MGKAPKEKAPRHHRSTRETLSVFSGASWYSRGVLGRSAEGAGWRVPLDIKPGMHECKTCGLFQEIPPLEKGHLAECARCGTHLARRRRTIPLQGPLALCFANAALYIALLLVPLLQLNVRGHINTATLLTGPAYLASHGFGTIGILVYITSAIMPGLNIGLLTFILLSCSRHHLHRSGIVALVWYERIAPWSMSGIYMIGLIVAYTKLIDLAVVTILPGTWLLLALMIGIAAMQSVFNPDLIWRDSSINKNLTAHTGAQHTPASHMVSCRSCGLVLAAKEKIKLTEDLGDCPRCGQILRKRKLDSRMRCRIFLLSAIVCYIPANLLPVMSFTKVGKGHPSTIIHGVQELWSYQQYYLALIVLSASVVIPVLKILALFWMLLTEDFKSRKHLYLQAHLYRAVEHIGRWSMIDVFMISILCGLVRFDFFAEVLPEEGVIFFAAVVILTIIAADLFDPRGMWDAAGLNRDSIINTHQEERAIAKKLEKKAKKKAK